MLLAINTDLNGQLLLRNHVEYVLLRIRSHRLDRLTVEVYQLLAYAGTEFSFRRDNRNDQICTHSAHTDRDVFHYQKCHQWWLWLL